MTDDRKMQFCAAIVRCPWCGRTVAQLWWEHTGGRPVEDGTLLIFGARDVVPELPQLRLHGTIGREGDNTVPKWCETPTDHQWSMPMGVESRVRAAVKAGAITLPESRIQIRARRVRVRMSPPRSATVGE